MPLPNSAVNTRGGKGGLLGKIGRNHSADKRERSASRTRDASDEDDNRRTSISIDVLRHLGKEKKKSSFEDLSIKQGKLGIKIESPPLVSYGKPEGSTGALMSGQLRIILTEKVKIETFTLELVARVKYTKPVHKDCSECSVKENELKKWMIIRSPKTFAEGEHSTPFSYLLPGHLPATTHCALANIDYVLKAVATTSTGEKMKTHHILILKRALMPPDLPRTATRVFPPTPVKADIRYPLVVFPEGTFNVELELTGIIGKMPTAPGADLMRRWKLRKLIWEITEHSKAVSPACAKHGAKLGGAGRGIEHESERSIGGGELREGWKLDWAGGENGRCELEIQCHINPGNPGGKHPSCDVKDPSGLEVRHRVMLEMIIFEEIAADKKITQWNSTGSARVLRFSFQVLVTDRAGMGVSWDEETPPMYEDVPRSPPGYIYDTLTQCESREIPDIAALELSSEDGEADEEAPAYTEDPLSELRRS